MIAQWKKWNEQGFIPGAEETEQAFISRIQFCEQLQDQFKQEMIVSSSLSQEAFYLTKELYGIAPKWVPLYFSNRQLAPWHGGCACIFQQEKNGLTGAFLQLRAHFHSSPTYLGCYHRKELMAHEMAHIGRMMYEDSQFEEFFAYQSSLSPWRRWLGPLIQSSRESLFFIAILGLACLANLLLFFTTSETSMNLLRVVTFFPFLVVIYGLKRLFTLHRLYKRCFARLQTFCPSLELARHLLYRLRDSEIRQFARFSPAAIQQWIEKESQRSFRWRFLNALYGKF